MNNLVPPPPPPPSPPRVEADFGLAPPPPAKRQRTEADQLAGALTKIASHISNPKKFSKAAPLLRQMFDDGKLSGAHGDLAFACLKAAMRSPERCQAAELRKEYVKLFTVASKNAQIFSAREKEQLDVYGLLAVLRSQLQTDDSFVLSRILGRIKTSIEGLAEATPAEEEIYQQTRGQPGFVIAAVAQDGAVRPGTVSDLSSGAPVAEITPAGIGPSSGTPNAVAEDNRPDQPEETWTEEQAAVMKREALLLCLEAAKEMHSKLWARTSVEIAFTEAHKQREKFVDSQHPRLDALNRFAKEQRLGRQQGRAAAKDDRRDRTAFETARKEWSKTSGISGRGALDSGGDHRSEVWLG